MFSNFSIGAKEQNLYGAGITILQSAAGFLSGHTINTIAQWWSPGKVILGQPPTVIINPLAACVCSLIFGIVDQIAQKILEQSDLKDSFNKPLCQLIRIAVSVTLSALISSLILGITFKIAAITILCGLVASTIFLAIAKKFSEMAYPQPFKLTTENTCQRIGLG